MKKTKSAAVGMILLSGCTFGVDGSYVGTGGSVVGAESAVVESGPVRGEGVAVRTTGDSDHVTVTWSIEGERVYDASLSIEGAIIGVLHGAHSVPAELRIESDGYELALPASVSVRSLGGDRYELSYTAVDDNGPIEGTIVFRVETGHC